jgi:hypothetical protein
MRDSGAPTAGEGEGDASGWYAFRTDLPEEAPDLAFFCPECAWREFGRGR